MISGGLDVNSFKFTNYKKQYLETIFYLIVGSPFHEGAWIFLKLAELGSRFFAKNGE